MRWPSTRAKVEAEIAKARQGIITKLVPQGENVTRHLSLPSQGQSAQWIVQEMEKMDAESESTGLWKQGKLSGAVYRTSTS
jgi:sphinganine-1-phosphate aldolase